MEIKKPNPYKSSEIRPKICGERKERNVHGVYEKHPQQLFKIRWKYITNKSGSREYFFTGLEIDSTLTEYADSKTIFPGDIVIFNKNGHANDGIKAKVKKVIKGIEGLEAKKKGIEEKNLPKYYDLKFLHPPTINLKRIKRLQKVDEKNIKKVFVKKTYKCIPSYYNEEKFKEELKRFARLHFTKNTPFVPQQIIARNARNQSKDTLDLNAHIDPKEEDKFKINRINYISHTEPKWNKKRTHKNVEVLLRIDLIDVTNKTKEEIANESMGEMASRNIDNTLSNASSILNCHHRNNQLGQDLKSVGRDIKNKIESWFLPPDEDGGDDVSSKSDSSWSTETKHSSMSGGTDPNQITQNIETKMNDIVNEPQDPLTNILGAPPEGPVPPAAPAPMDIIEDDDEDDAGVPQRQFSPGDEVIFEGNRYRILRVDGINNNGVREYSIVPIDTNTDPMMAPRNARENELTLATATPEPPLWQQHLLMTPAQQAWLEEEQEGGGCGQSKPSTVRPTLTQEEINEWMDFFNKETNDNEKMPVRGFQYGGNNELNDEETKLITNLFL